MATPSKSQSSNSIDLTYQAPIPDESELTDLIGSLEPVIHNYQVQETDKETEEVQLPVELNSEDDFKYVHKNLKSLIKNGSSAMNDMIKLARASDHPRAYEVLNQMLKTIADLNGELLEVHKKKKELTKNDEPAPQQPTGPTTTNVFVGTTDEFLTKIRNKALQQQGVIIDHDEQN